MKYVLAISGGIDSCVILDMVANGLLYGLSQRNSIVAHFDHGIREESNYDAELVRRLAKKYGFEFVLDEAKLGEYVSEDTARQARYGFLRSVAKKNNAKIVTAHHQDDLLETVIMNILRGTGWRGLAPMWAKDIERPLLRYSKADLVEYAIEHKLEWAEDETNYSPKYFRNRIREIVYRMEPSDRRKLINFSNEQKKLRQEIEEILNQTINLSELKKEVIEKLPNQVAVEVLRKWTGEKLTYPQINKLLNDIENTKGGIDIQPGGKLVVKIRKGILKLSSI